MNSFVILIRAWKAFDYFDACINSIFLQTYKRYRIIYIDDCSQYTAKQKRHIRQKLINHTVIFNTHRQFSVKNAYDACHTLIGDQEIVVSLDGDDWFLHPFVLQKLNSVYANSKCAFTYGNARYYDPRSGRHHGRVDQLSTFQNHSYTKQQLTKSRLLPFQPHHLKTWRNTAFKNILTSAFLLPTGEWLRFGEDMIIFFGLLEQKALTHVVIREPLMVYNVSHHKQDARIHSTQKLFEEIYIRRRGQPLLVTDRISGITTIEIKPKLSSRLRQIVTDLQTFMKIFFAAESYTLGPGGLLTFLTIKILSMHLKTVRVESALYSEQLQLFAGKIHIDFRKRQPSRNDSRGHDQLLWLLVYASSISENSRTLLLNQFPHNASLRALVTTAY